ncbi:MAG: hypothetical protein MPN21_20765 [Thermoanaerobaculia bacterium]|nr:hypothetical protein [Thermoanaerobaculia bacterium]
MWILARNEWSRFRRWTTLFALAHLMVLLVQEISGSLFHPASAGLDSGLLRYSLAMYALLGLTLGWLQMRGYRHPALWVFLMHRPLAPHQIFLALVASGTLVLSVVVALPLAAVTFVLDQAGTRWIDLRHYGMTPFAFGTSMTGYLLGCLFALSTRWTALAAALLPMFFLSRSAVGWWSLAPLLVVVSWLGVLAGAQVRPDRQSPERRALPLALTALPLQYALFWCLMFAGLMLYTARVAVVEAGWNVRGFAAHSWNDYFADGTFDRAQYLFDGDAMAHGLELDPSDRSRDLLARIDLDRVVELVPRRWRAPARHQPMFLDEGQLLEDSSRDRHFAFSHDLGLFQGWSVRTLSAVGWLGVSGLVSDTELTTENPTRFEEVPYVFENRQVLTGRRIYRFDSEHMRFDLWFESAGDERLAAPISEHADFLATWTDRRLLLFLPAATSAHRGNLSPFASVPLSGQLRNLEKILVAPVDGGFAVSVVYGTLSSRDLLPARQQVFEVDANGRADLVTDTPLGHGPPAWSRHWGFIMSPFLRSLHDVIWTAVAPRRSEPVRLGDLLQRPPPAKVLGLAAWVAACSAAMTAWLVRRRRLRGRERWAWVLAAALTGLPGFLSFLFVMPAPDRARAEPPPPRARLPGAADVTS